MTCVRRRTPKPPPIITCWRRRGEGEAGKGDAQAKLAKVTREALKLQNQQAALEGKAATGRELYLARDYTIRASSKRYQAV